MRARWFVARIAVIGRILGWAVVAGVFLAAKAHLILGVVYRSWPVQAVARAGNRFGRASGINRTVAALYHSFRSKSFGRRAVVISMSSVLVFGIAYDMFSPFTSRLVDARYELSSSAEQLLVPKISYYGPLIEENPQAGTYEYNQGYRPGGEVAGQTTRPKFSATIHKDPQDGIGVFDVINQVGVQLKPRFDLGEPRIDVNRVLYPLYDGTDGVMVVSLGTTGYKEDIVIDQYRTDSLTYDYDLVTPDGVEARLDDDGSLSFYGVDSALLGDVTTSTPEDEALLAQARRSGDKQQLLFRIPAPVVLEGNRQRSEAHAWFTLEDNVLSVNTRNLRAAQYPISIDPSIYIETARKLMRGNNESNVDFDVENELIKKGFTTGARFDEWNNATDLNEARWNGGTAVGGGFIYSVGGERATIGSSVYSTAGTDTFIVPAGVTQVTVKSWGGGGGGGGGSTRSDGGSGGGAGYVEATISTTPAETLNVIVGGGGTGGAFSTGGAGSNSGDGGGGGGHSEVNRSGTALVVAAGGGGGGGGDNSGGGGGTDGGGGGAGGGTTGSAGGASSNAPGGSGGTPSTGGSGGDSTGNGGSNGSSEQGGDGGNGSSSEGDGDGGGVGLGGINGGGNGGTADVGGNGFGAGGGGGGGYYGGGGGSASISGNRGGGGGGGGSSYTVGGATAVTNTAGSGTVPGNDTDTDRSGAGVGGGPGVGTSLPASSGGNGTDGIVLITYDIGSAAITQAQTPVTATCHDASASGCTVSATITAATAGNHIIAVCSGEVSGGTWSNLDIDGYASAVAESASSNSGQEIFFKVALGGETTVDCTITGNSSTGVSGFMTVYEYSGLAGAPVDVTSASTGSSTSPSTGTTATTSQPDILLLAGMHTEAASATFGSWTNSFTEDTDQNRANPVGGAQATATRVVDSTGTFSTAATTSNDQWIAQLVAFKADTLGTGSEARSEVYWAELSSVDNSIESPNPGAGACTQWCTNGAYDLPDERVGFSFVSYNGFLYVIGGEDSTGTRQDTVYIAKLGVNGEPSLWHPTDGDQDNWVYWYPSTNTLTNATSYGSAVAYNNRLYFSGGQTNAAAGGVSDMYVAEFNPTGDIQAWSTTGMPDLPSVRHMHTMHVYNDYIYLVGGNSSGTLQDTTYYTDIASDGSIGTWTATSSFTTARSTWGGSYSTIWGGYLYLAGGCSAVDAGGECTTIALDIQLASINADGTLDTFNVIDNVTNERIGYSLVAWDNALYRIGGCTSQDASTGECLIFASDEDYAVINVDGDASTVAITEDFGAGNCIGATPYNCDLPDAGDDAGEGGQMLSSVAVLNGFLYVIGGCIDYDCNGTNPAGDDSDASGNVSYSAINSDGTLGRPEVCSGTYSQSGSGSWCVDSTNRVNGTDGIATAGIAVFNGAIYLVGGVDDSNDIDGIYRNTVNDDGSLAGAWTFQNWTAVGIGAAEEIYYAYAYARANPASAGTNPGNLYILGGCGDFGGSGIGCGNSDYRGEVYKCNIGTSGAISGCSTSGQLQIDIDSGTAGDQGIGAHAGSVYANRIYLIAGLDSVVTDRDEVLYAEFDDSNNIVAISGETEWAVASNALDQPRRRGSGFGYNGFIYGVGGFESSGTILNDIEFGQVDVSTGDIGAFTTSSVTINQRWGLAMAVTNSYAYVIGGCNVGNSPGGCSSFEPSVQTFQLYNNNSGSAAGFTTGAKQFGIDRYGASAAVVDGYIYLAGGCIDTVGDCSQPTANIQSAPLTELGEIGTWSSTSAQLPEARGWGQLEVAGGDLYYLGGQDAAGDEKSDIYYTTPASETTGTLSNTIRTTQYKLDAGEYTGTNYTLSLEQDLQQNYFVMIQGSDDTVLNRSVNRTGVRVAGDPFGSIESVTSDDAIELSRRTAVEDWIGSITVVECLRSCATDGFITTDVLNTNLSASPINAKQNTDVTLSQEHSSNTVFFGGYGGGGMESGMSTVVNFASTAQVRLRRQGTDQLRIERYGTSGRAPGAADITTYVVEWGSSWGVQEVNVDAWAAGGTGADATSEYHTESIDTVTTANTWVWKSPGNSSANTLGNTGFGATITLGDGVTVDATENTLALGKYYVAGTVDDTVFIMSHSDLAVDHTFVPNGAKSGSFTRTVDSPVDTETRTVLTNSTRVTGSRFPTWFPTNNSGSTTAWTQLAGWSFWNDSSTTIDFDNAETAGSYSGWAQSVDFGDVESLEGTGNITSWSTASGGIGDTSGQAAQDRTQFGAAVWNDRIYVVGGLNDSGTATNTVFISPDLSSGGDIAANSWTSDADVPDVARSGNVVIAYANNLYTLGGYDNSSNYLLDAQFTQINTDGSVDPWTFTTPLPDTVRLGDGFAANGYMYLVGGESSAGVCDSNTYIAPISANTTIATGNNPTGLGEWFETNQRYNGERMGNAVAYNEGRMYIMGGACDSINFPEVKSTVETEFNADTTAHDVQMPATVESGDLLLAFFSNDGGASVTTPSGWTLIDTDNSGASTTRVRASIFARDADGTEDGTTVDFVTSGAERATAQVHRILASDWSGTIGTGVEASTTVDSGSFSDPNPPSLNPSSWGTEKTLWFAYVGGSSFDLDGVVSSPSGYSNIVHNQSNSGTAGSSTMTATIQNEAASENPGQFTMSVNEDGIAFTVAVRPGTAQTTLTGINRTVQTTLLIQPQIAKYSRLIDTDTDVFPTNFLLNGIDNSIGARWTARYRSSTDTTSTWGQETNFGDVTLGTVNSYTARDGAGADTSFARFYSFFIEIDASQTYGYPEDVERGPTINDLTLFFTSDPNKRLRHGKTFTGGEEQPLDTPPP